MASSHTVPRQEIGWLVAGASEIARAYMVAALRAAPGGDVVALVSRDPARARAFANAAGIARLHDSYGAALADPVVDAVYIGTTNELHAPYAIAAAEAGKHVLCEKPLALTMDEGRAILAACHEAGVVGGVNHHLRAAPASAAARRLVAAGRIGRPLSACVLQGVGLPEHLRTWRLAGPAAGGGAALDQTVHDADLLAFVLDDEVVEVAALERAGGGQEIVGGALRLRSGLVASFHDGFVLPHAGSRLELHGSAGSLTITDALADDPIQRLTIVDADGPETLELEPRCLYLETVARFNAAVGGAGTPSATIEDGLRSLATALAVSESAADGVRMSVG